MFDSNYNKFEIKRFQKECYEIVIFQERIGGPPHYPQRACNDRRVAYPYLRSMKRIAVFTSGGDAPGMNAHVRAVERVGEKRGIEVIGISHRLLN